MSKNSSSPQATAQFSSIQAVVLAAGSSSRFRTSESKLCATLCGKALVAYPISVLNALSLPTICVVGHQKERVRAVIEASHNFCPGRIHFTEQTEQRGTGHALLCTRALWTEDLILVLYGDAPFVNTELIENVITQHHKTNATVTFVVARSSSAAAQPLGRVDVDDRGIRIIEARHDSVQRTEKHLVNAGIYLFDRRFLEETLPLLLPNQDSNELYLTDLIHTASAKGAVVSLCETSFDTIRGINTLEELWEAEEIKRKEIVTTLMHRGVRFIQPTNVIIEPDVTIEPDTLIGPGVVIINKTHIGRSCTIGAYSILDHCTLEEAAVVHPHSIISNSFLGIAAQVGPFAHIQKSIVSTKAVVGNFVETKRTAIGPKSKAKHLSYLGDTTVGAEANIGAGTITCNYDGFAKHQTIIEDGASIASLNALVAPVTIGPRAATAAGSVITESVPADALAIARSKQITKENYAPHLRERLQQKAALKKALEKEHEDDSLHTHGGPALWHGKLRENRSTDGDSQSSS